MNAKKYEAEIERDYIILYRLYHTRQAEGRDMELIEERLEALEEVLEASQLARVFAGLWTIDEIPGLLRDAGLISHDEYEQLLNALGGNCDNCSEAKNNLRPLMHRLFGVWHKREVQWAKK